ncbi:unnamed protein product [Nippostrongylus brasiliensis]|uniref:protein-histidine N-methyltransferase n=1 Tax=Nippostrongylus brasiliensis TaxID=27835 RepID=A0A3P7AI29_NIPBR|nr:unnamed protein product [Nippostrongylus brasiliensis]
MSDVELVWADDELVRRRLAEEGFSGDEALKNISHSDRTTHVYEGGFKIWECCYDLCQLVDSESSAIRGTNVLEHCPRLLTVCCKVLIQLGCGAGLPGILCALRGAAHVVFHDYNDFVIKCFTKENLRLNGVGEDRYSLMSGSWADFQQTVVPRSFDFILTSETIYNPDDYQALHDAFDFALSPGGVIWVAAKIFYFGVGGDIPAFIEFVEKRGVFVAKTKLSIEADIPRVILELRRSC